MISDPTSLDGNSSSRGAPGSYSGVRDQTNSFRIRSIVDRSVDPLQAMDAETRDYIFHQTSDGKSRAFKTECRPIPIHNPPCKNTTLGKPCSDLRIEGCLCRAPAFSLVLYSISKGNRWFKVALEATHWRSGSGSWKVMTQRRHASAVLSRKTVHWPTPS